MKAHWSTKKEPEPPGASPEQEGASDEGRGWDWEPEVAARLVGRHFRRSVFGSSAGSSSGPSAFQGEGNSLVRPHFLAQF